MLAAHRRGGRTSLDTFARAWDGYTNARGARLATERELRTLESMLEASLADEESPRGGNLAKAIAEHLEAEERRARVGADAATRRDAVRRPPGDPDRSSELRKRPGWAWLRVFRRLDEYEAALAALRAQEPAERSEPPVGAGRET